MAERTRIFFVVSLSIVILLVVVSNVLTLLFNANLAAVSRLGIQASPSKGIITNGTFLGEITMDRSGPDVSYRFQYHGLTSIVTGLVVKGPIPNGAEDATDVAFTLCGSPCMSCIIVGSQISGKFRDRCDDGASLTVHFEEIFREPLRYYLQVNTGLYPSGIGEMRAYFVSLIGWNQ